MRPGLTVTMATVWLIIAVDILVWIYWIHDMKKYIFGRLVVIRPGLTVTLGIFHRGVNSSRGTRPRCLMTHAQGKSKQFNTIIVLSHNHNHASMQFVQRIILQPVWSLRQRYFVATRVAVVGHFANISIAANDPHISSVRCTGILLQPIWSILAKTLCLLQPESWLSVDPCGCPTIA